MRLLDCGCGPGTITIGLAQHVAPGEVVGIDNDPDHIELARQNASEQAVPTNLRFEVADVYGLPFEEGSFDAIFSHALLEYLADPARALREMRRLLGPGGMVYASTPDHDGHLCWPTNSSIEQWFALEVKLHEHDGGDRYRGKRLRALLSEVGFAQTAASARYYCAGDSQMTQWWVDYAVGACRSHVYGARWVDLGWVDPAGLEAMAEAWRAWGQDPAAFYVRTMCDAIGWVT
jgi:SAM-dependent methyltransferase